MLEFMRAGGFGIWIVLLFGIITLFSSARFALKPDDGRVGFLRGMSAATVFSIFTAVSSNLAMVMWRVPNVDELGKSPDVHLIVMMGIAEALTPAILGSAFLTLAWLMIAVGHRRNAPSFA
ncbi:MAG: hypothetical protein RIT81_36065 [Deltaproteobacteria bacterium]